MPRPNPWLAAAGVLGYTIINVVVGFVVVGSSTSMANAAPFVVAAVGLALFALGGGLVLILLRRPWSLGLGIGLMIGWGAVSIISAGWCTGLNPGLYA